MTGPAPTLLTPTPRLARDLLRQQAADNREAGHLTWITPEIHSFQAWLARIRDDYLLDGDERRIPITTDHSLLLWQSLIDQEVFIGEPEVASLAQRAWRLLHEYQLDQPHLWPALLLSEDARRFKTWSAAYRRECDRRGLLDEWSFTAAVPELLAAGRIPAPAAIELVGFELPLTPLQQKIVDACESAGCRVARRDPQEHNSGRFELAQYPDPTEELLGAACWARNLLETDPRQKIAIVVPDLSTRVSQADRLFRRIFDPHSFGLADSGSEPWHISLGQPLAQWPLVADALVVLSLADTRISQPDAGVMLRSPYLAGSQQEAEARNTTLSSLTTQAPYEITPRELQWALQQAGAELLSENLAAWQQGRDQSPKQAWPSQWSAVFQQELSRLGFGAGRSLDSREYQTLQRWHELLEAFGTLDLVAAHPLTRGSAIVLLTQRAQAAVFRERNPGVPIEILGIEEALGSRFDAMWITTLDSDTWPGPVLRDPLIPASLQQQIPRSTSEGVLVQAQRELGGLRNAAALVRGSYAQGTQEVALEPTRLLGDARQTPAAVTPPASAAQLADAIVDETAPALTGGRARGGTGVLKDQSSCPFKAFAQRRLGAVELRPPKPGLDAGQRGTVIHLALERFWNDAGDSQQLERLQPDELTHRVETAVTQALQEFTRRYLLTLSSAGRRLEQARTERVVLRWLEVEKQRSDFRVIAQEQPIELTIAGLRLSGKIDRLDELADGTKMLIDYKTGRAGKGDWFPQPRIVDPQLPAYAVASQPPPGAISFARIRPEELRFDGLADGDTGTPGVTDLASAKYNFKDIDSWHTLLTDWQTHLDALAGSFSRGLASVDPRKSKVCDSCHLHALCRIHERAPLASLLQEDVDD